MFSSRHPLSLFRKTPTLQLNLIPFFFFWSASKVSEGSLTLFSLIGLQFDPNVGLGFCLLAQGGNERQRAARSWLQQLRFSDSAEIIFTCRSGQEAWVFLSQVFEDFRRNTWLRTPSSILAVGSSRFISSSSVCLVYNLTEVSCQKLLVLVLYLQIWVEVFQTFVLAFVGAALKSELLLFFVLVSCCCNNKSRVWKNKHLAGENLVWAHQL